MFPSSHGGKTWRNHNIWDAFAFWIGRQRENSSCVYTGTNTFGDWVSEIKNIIDIGCICSSQGRQGRDLGFRFSGRGETQPVWNKDLDGCISSQEYTLGNGSTPHWNAEYLSYFLALSLFPHCFSEACSWRNNCLIVTLDVPGAAQHSQTKRQEGEERLKRQNNFSSVNHWVLSESFLHLVCCNPVSASSSQCVWAQAVTSSLHFGYFGFSLFKRDKQTPKLIKSRMLLLGEHTNFLSSLPDTKRLAQETSKKKKKLKKIALFQFGFQCSSVGFHQFWFGLEGGNPGNSQHKPDCGKWKHQEKANCSTAGQETKPWLEIQTQTIRSVVNSEREGCDAGFKSTN